MQHPFCVFGCCRHGFGAEKLCEKGSSVWFMKLTKRLALSLGLTAGEKRGKVVREK